MKLYELLNQVEIQGEVKIVYYDWEKEERIEISMEEARYKEVRYMYVDDGEVMYIEVVNEED